MLGALEKGTDPDRMKGALYVLWNKGTGMRLQLLEFSYYSIFAPAGYTLAGKDDAKSVRAQMS